MKSVYLYVVLLFALFNSCVKEEPQFTIPYARVRFEIDINGADSDLQPFTFKVFTKPRNNDYIGYGGLLVFRNYDNRIFAYDLCCPYEDDKSILVKPLDEGKAYCEKCGSRFITMYGLGTPESGPAKENLQIYNVTSISNRGGAFIITN